MANENRIEFYETVKVAEDKMKTATVVRHASGTIGLDFTSFGGPFMSFGIHLTRHQAQLIYNSLALAIAGEVNCPEEPASAPCTDPSCNIKPPMPGHTHGGPATEVR